MDTLNNIDYENLPRRPFKGRLMTTSELVFTHRSPHHAFMRFERYWMGVNNPSLRPHDYTLSLFNASTGEAELCSKVVDVNMWRQPPSIGEYSTKRTRSEILMHQRFAEQANRGELGIWPVTFCLN